jgi:hypothetical protein
LPQAKEVRLNYNNWNDSSDNGEGKKKYRFRDKKKKKFQKMISRACAALSDLNFEVLDFTVFFRALEVT